MSISNVLFSEITRFDYRLLAYSQSKFEDDWQSLEHSHQYCELLFVTNGSGQFVYNGVSAPLQKGSLVITNANVLHTEFSDKASPLEYVVFSIDNIIFDIHSKTFDFDDSAESTYFDKSFVLNFQNGFSYISGLIKKFENEIALKKNYYQIVCQDIINELVIFIFRESALINSVELSESDFVSNKISRVPTLISSYIAKYYANNITLDFLATKFFINKYYLIKVFNKTFGLSPIQYLNKVRIEKAKNLLETTDFSISNISSQVGFLDSAYFAKTFKAITGKTPTAIITQSRKHNQKDSPPGPPLF